jgi:hypothetical protein
VVNGDYPQLGAAEGGLWVQFGPSPAARARLPWDDITRVSGYRCEGGGDAVDVWVALDTDGGEFLEIADHFGGFHEVAASMVRHLPGLAPGWLEGLASLSLEEEPLTVWRRQRA